MATQTHKYTYSYRVADIAWKVFSVNLFPDHPTISSGLLFDRPSKYFF